MTGSTPARTPPSRQLGLAVFSTVAYLAGVITVFGFTSLWTNTEVIVEPDAGPLLGPAMVAAACVVIFVALMRTRQRTVPVARSIATAASVYASMLAVGALGYTWTRGEPVWLLLFAGRYATSPFVVGAALLAAAVVAARWAVDRQPARD